MKKVIKTLLSIMFLISLTACTINIYTDGEKQGSQQQTITDNTQVDPLVKDDQNGQEELIEQSNDELEELYAKWSTIIGYWSATENRYAVVDMADNHTLCFEYGMWETSYSTGEAKVTKIFSEQKDQLTAEITYTTSENKTVEEQIQIDLSGLDRDGKIRIKYGEEDWYQYMKVGDTREEAFDTYLENAYPQEEPFDPSTIEQTYEEREALFDQWYMISGYWNSNDGRYIVLDAADAHTLCIEYGMWDSEYSTGYKDVYKIYSEAENELTVIIDYQNKENDISYTKIRLDLSSYLNNGKLQIKIDDDAWYLYMLGGMTQEEAYNTYLDSLNYQ
ncbi:MAG: hypothetical protein E7191_07930 [Erysipelotrichaceae bacterium]|nr:hypothetical protein [Erysipelotrichaceae bacterium]